MTSWHHGEEVKVWQDEENTQGVRRRRMMRDRRHVGGDAMTEKEIWDGMGEEEGGME